MQCSDSLERIFREALALCGSLGGDLALQTLLKEGSDVTCALYGELTTAKGLLCTRSDTEDSKIASDLAVQLKSALSELQTGSGELAQMEEDIARWQLEEASWSEAAQSAKS